MEGEPFAVVVMGPAGCGKTTLGRRIAELSGRRFVEGDDLHPAENVARMAAGVPLDDDDRWPWLAKVAEELARAKGSAGVVASCSALKRSYRDLIRERSAVDVLFVFPRLDRTALAPRLQDRPGHYMPASLLGSQLETLEPPGADEAALTLDGAEPVDRLAERVVAVLDGRRARAAPDRGDLDEEGSR